MKRKLSQLVKQYTPEPAKQSLYRSADILASIRLSRIEPSYESEADNIYHCCAHRTASQWIKQIFSDLRIYQSSGLRLYNTRMDGPSTESYEQRAYRLFPPKRIVSSLYISYEAFLHLPKPQQFRCFFVMRDPRDIVISHYFSSKVSHTPMGDILERRKLLNQLCREDGIIYTIQYLHSSGVFQALASWRTQHEPEENIKLVRYEDLTGLDQQSHFQSLLQFCDIRMATTDIEALLADYSFENMSGRERGDKDVNSHYRQGRSGDWRDYFTPRIHSVFNELTGDLVQDLGYDG